MNHVLSTRPHSSLTGRFYRLKRMLWTAVSTCSLSGLYAGRICPTWIRFTRMDMPLPDLPKPFEGKTLVHISDLHCSPMVLGRYLVQVLAQVAAQNPDFIAITGDLITGGTYYARRVASILAALPASIACIACLGNHDHGIYHPSGRGLMRQLPGYLSRRLFEAGVHVLRNQHAIFTLDGQAIQFVGIDDMWSNHYDPAAAFADAHTDLPTIALTHNPDAAMDVAARGPHWILSGHTHGNAAGENRLRDVVFPVDSRHFAGGYYALDNAHLYVNRGLSYARRLNLNRRPEITVFKLTKA